MDMMTFFITSKLVAPALRPKFIFREPQKAVWRVRRMFIFNHAKQDGVLSTCAPSNNTAGWRVMRCGGRTIIISTASQVKP